MRTHRYAAELGVTMAVALTATGCQGSGAGHHPKAAASAGPASCAKGSITAQGAADQQLAMADLIQQYQKSCPGSTISFQGTGSDAGIPAFAAGTADFAASDVAVTDSPAGTRAGARCHGGTAVDLPVAGVPVDVVDNMGDNSVHLNPPVLARIYTGRITSWDDPAIKALNQGSTMPSLPIRVVYRSDGSSEASAFADFMAKNAAGSWPYGESGTWHPPVGTAVSGADALASMVGNTKGAIGLLENPFVWVHSGEASGQAGSLDQAILDTPSGQEGTLTPEEDGTRALSRAAMTGKGDDLKLTMDRTDTDPSIYPLMLVTYDVVCTKGNDPGRLALLKGFLGYVTGAGQARLDDPGNLTDGYSKLPEPLRKKAAALVARLS